MRNHWLSSTHLLALCAVASLGAACTRDDGVTSNFDGRVGVSLGDFDDVSAPLKRMDAAHRDFEGLISVATWDDSFEPANLDLKVEDLFLGDNGQGQLSAHAAVFIGSGTRGFGARQYNSLDADDQLVQDERTQDNTQRFVNRGGPLLVTDWAYELVDTIWPEQMTFLVADPRLVGDSWTDLDAAQVGRIGSVTASVVDADLAEYLGSDTLALDYPYSNFTVLESVGDDVTVHLRGDVSYRLDELSEPVDIADVPLLVSFRPEGERGGTVIYSTFHVDAQNPALMDELLHYFFGDFEVENSDAVIE